MAKVAKGDDSRILSTKGADYTGLLVRKQTASWRKILQAPYRRNLKNLKLGFVLDIGCGIGRNLIILKGSGVGIDHNEESVEFTRRLGYEAFTPGGFRKSSFNRKGRFDSMLLSHVAEHMHKGEVISLLRKYAGLLKPGGRLIIICPQEAGFRGKPTHVEFMDFGKLRGVSKGLGFTFLEEYSFPFPRFFGRFFTYNEFVSVSRKPAS
jgi:SAM-dependent methyltransferase